MDVVLDDFLNIVISFYLLFGCSGGQVLYYQTISCSWVQFTHLCSLFLTVINKLVDPLLISPQFRVVFYHMNVLGSPDFFVVKHRFIITEIISFQSIIIWNFEPFLGRLTSSSSLFFIHASSPIRFS
jgi:hypothetical protein